MDGVVRHAIRAAGEVLLTVGLVGLLFIGYLIWGTGLRAASAQRALAGELNQQWQRPGDGFGARAEQFDVATGQPFAFITIPAFGQQWRFTLIQGTALAQLNQSPGHVPGTQWPGQLGHRQEVGGADRHGRARPGAQPPAAAAHPAADHADHLRPGLDRHPPGNRHRSPGRRQAPLDEASDTSGARMYAWLWHRLPGRTPARAGVMALIILVVAAALWFYVFPWASLHLPIDSSGFTG
jgi:hypothetical protein